MRLAPFIDLVVRASFAFSTFKRLLCLWVLSHSARLAPVCRPANVPGLRPSACDPSAFAQNRGPGRKVSDEFAVPLCRLHHCEFLCHHSASSGVDADSVTVDAGSHPRNCSRGTLPRTLANVNGVTAVIVILVLSE